ncbi:Exoribonuclease II, mitochondrial [Cyberlindnera fabianii]|uniref:Exoribonuclease II, mitochondrial n=1 Tax=Cyberlindnera fabianii TaxID=36022 RepID=A0A1V2L381_CYBFA|nr:Exoribonuclease II, mitochondrial [Cyberlindnera fabianii]
MLNSNTSTPSDPSPPSTLSKDTTHADESASEKVRKQLSESQAVSEEVRKARRRSMAELRGPIQTKSLKTILEESHSKYRQRYSRPSQTYAGLMRNDLVASGNIPKNHATIPAHKLFERLGKPRDQVTLSDLFTPLDIGDAVELSTQLNKSVLSVIVEVPFRHDDPRYAVMDRLGQLSYVEKSAFKLRIPQVVPKAWLKRAVHRVKEVDAEYGSIKSTNDGFQVFAVNPFVRSVIAKPLLSLTNAAWAELQQTSRKLEILHRILQTMGPRQIPLTVLVKAVKEIDLLEFETMVRKKNSVTEAYRSLSDHLHKTVGDDFASGTKAPALGKEYGATSPNESYDAALMYSVILALRKQTLLWSTGYTSRSTFLPLSITALPMSYTTKITDIVESLKKKPELINKFSSFVKKGDFSVIDPQFEPIFYLLREYAVGNVNDAVSETLVCQLMKNFFDVSITRTMVWELLQRAGVVPTEMTNPTHFAMRLALPNKGVSEKADLEERYFELVDVAAERDGDLARFREDMTHLNVYCIDSETAHEIDDGVSIEKVDDNTVRLHIHIADPVSYMEPDSDLAKIAFERAFTTYQPEMISAMFPKSMSELAGLGVDGKLTRALTFSVLVDSNTGVANFAEATVKATHLSRFPKYTYDDVDAVLARIDQAGGRPSNTEQAELLSLKKISELLRKARVDEGAVIFPDKNLSVQIRVSPADSSANEVDTRLDDGSDLSITSSGSTPSVVLVTELMILANRIAGIRLQEAGVSGVYKAMPTLPLQGSARSLVPRMNALSVQNENSQLSVSDIVKSLKFVTPAIYSAVPASHQMLGVQCYAPSTSPLRRFGDVVNHFQFHSHLNGQGEIFTPEQVQSMILHIEARNDILKKASRAAGSFYALRYLKEQLQKGVQLKDAQFVVMSKPVNGSVSGVLLGYGVFGELKLLEGVKPPLIGQVLEDFAIEDIDYVDGVLRLMQL